MAVMKSRLWAFLLYPESMPEDWQRRLTELYMPLLVSPLHDSDADENGELKKPHYHVLVILEGPVTDAYMLERLEPLGVKHLLKVASRLSYERYLCHLDNPDKYTYPVAEIQQFGGATPKFCIEEDFRDGFVALSRIIEERGFLLYADFARFVAFEAPEYCFTLERFSSHFNNVCRSRFDAYRYNANKTDKMSYVKFRTIFEDWSS